MVALRSLVDHDEIDRYEQGVGAFLSGEMDPERFMAFRLQHGIYGQRQDGVHMLRIKVPGGGMDPAQLRAVAEVLERFSRHHLAHITTRQDFQVHHVPLADTPAAMRVLAHAGLTTREACGNTVRNVTSCPLAGVCPHEHTDVTPFNEMAVRHFLRHPLTQHLPRKFKISFSGCEQDCAQGMMHDLGVVAVRRGDRFGFKVLAGGGLGHKPHEAILVEEFVSEDELLASMEAVVSLHHRYSDRKRRAKARIKFLVDKFGPEGFVEKYREELERTRAALASHRAPKTEWKAGRPEPQCTAGAPRAAFAQKQPGLVVFPISIPIGDMTAEQLRGVAETMDAHGLSDVRTTQDQNLMLIGVPESRLETVRAGLRAVGLGEPQAGDDVVACPGTSTCRLGITSSKIIGAKINANPTTDLRIRASGCHNGCAQPETGDIGIYGEGKRMHGKLIPHYQVYIGGDGRDGRGLAFKGPSVPAARVETAISRLEQAFVDDREDGELFFNWTRRKGVDYFKTLLEDLTVVGAEDVSSVLYDHGDESAFKVLQLGGGECAGAAQELVASNFSEAANERTYRDAFLSQRKYPEAIECAEQVARLIGQSLLFQAGHKPVEDLKEIATTLAGAGTDYAPLGEWLVESAQRLAALRDRFDEVGFKRLARELDEWTVQSAELCQHMDRQLDLTASVSGLAATGQTGSAQVIDLSSYGCPLHYIKARNELRKHGAGELVDFILASGEPTEQVSSSLAKDGHEIVAAEENGGTTKISVRKSAQVSQA